MKLSRLAALFAPLAVLFTVAITAPAARAETAVFAGGCFWCMEHDMQAIPGVQKVESGYIGGHVNNPSYEDVTSETSGHYEAVRVTFDEKRLPYGLLLERYWKLVDPTDAGGQFCDRGPSYRTAIFVTGAAQRKAAEASKVVAQGKLKQGKVVTPIIDAPRFWPAEEYHRDYAKRNAIRYDLYRTGCGRDRRLAQVWGVAGK
ncbi:MAG: peptide-methionine (S)-S-oxide reductase MsrA [Caulobacterales bacterium]|nr:peptide-methionine (S)-S-oxide reductase MsrA [Caulobacterales bacterium]